MRRAIHQRDLEGRRTMKPMVAILRVGRAIDAFHGPARHGSTRRCLEQMVGASEIIVISAVTAVPTRDAYGLGSRSLYFHAGSTSQVICH